MRLLLVPIAVAAAQGVGTQDITLTQDPNAAADMTEGLVAAFLNQSALPSAEYQCIVKGTKGLMKELVAVSKHSVGILQTLLNRGKGQAAQPMQPIDLLEGGAPALIFKLRAEFQKIYKLEAQLTEECIRGDLLEQLDLAGRHAVNLTFVGGHLMASGADIITEVTDAIGAYQSKQFRRFGRDMGLVYRKVLLEKLKVPDGPPSEVAVKRMSVGMIEGFFGGGWRLSVTSDTQPLNMDVDLSRCIGKDVEFFSSVWASAYLFFQELAKGKKDLGHGKWQQALAQALVYLPGAMRRCSVTAEQETMLLESIQALNSLHVNLRAPTDRMDSAEVSVALAKSIEDWSKGKSKDFGKDLGKLLRQELLVMFPQKYGVDSAGSLRRHLLGASEAHRGGVVYSHPGLSFWTVPLVAAVAALLLLASAVIRARKAATLHNRGGDELDEVDQEATE